MSKKLLCLILSMLLLLATLISCVWDNTPDMAEKGSSADSQDTLDSSDTSNTSDSPNGGTNEGNEPNTDAPSDQNGLQMDESGDGMRVSYEDLKKPKGTNGSTAWHDLG